MNATLDARLEAGDHPAVVVRAATARLPRFRYTAGKGAATLGTLRRLMPAATFVKAFRRDFRLDA